MDENTKIIFDEIDEIRERGVESLLASRSPDKKPGELSVKECAKLLGISEASAYSHMDNLVKDGTWETHLAFDKKIHRNIRVWSMLE